MLHFFDKLSTASQFGDVSKNTQTPSSNSHTEPSRINTELGRLDPWQPRDHQMSLQGIQSTRSPRSDSDGSIFSVANELETRKRKREENDQDLYYAAQLLLKTKNVVELTQTEHYENANISQCAHETVERDLPSYIEEGLFPICSVQPRGPHPSYIGSYKIISILKNGIALSEDQLSLAKSLIIKYLDTNNAERKNHLEQLMECRVLQEADVQELKGVNQFLLGQRGVFAQKNTEKGTFLGIYTGTLVCTEQEVAALESVIKPHENVTRMSWNLERINQKDGFVPFIASHSFFDGDIEHGSMLTKINTLVKRKRNKNGHYVTNKHALNVEAFYIESNIAKKLGLRHDQVAYFSSKPIKKGEQLFISYGYNYDFDFLSLAPQSTGYVYDQSNDRKYPLNIYDQTTNTIKPLAHPKKHVSIFNWEKYSANGLLYQVSYETLVKNITKFLDIPKIIRAKHYRDHFYVSNDQKVYAKKMIAQGAILGIYSGVIYEKNKEKDCAKLLKLEDACLDLHSWNLTANLRVSSCYQGNLLELISAENNPHIDVLEVNVSEEPDSLSANCIVYIAKNQIDPHTCLS